MAGSGSGSLALKGDEIHKSAIDPSIIIRGNIEVTLGNTYKGY